MTALILPAAISMETWVILGASSAVARAFARAVGNGADLILCGRDLADLAHMAADLHVRHGRPVAVVPFDALDEASHRDLTARLEQQPGTLNIFLAFGSMPAQAAMDADPALALRTIQANYGGAVSVLQHLAPRLERQGAGIVVALGSVAGDRGRLKNYVYGSAKAGLHTFLQGYRARMFRAGVRVLTVKPGFLDTSMTWAAGPLPMAMAPADFARALLRSMRGGAETIYLPWPWRWIMAIIRIIPESLFKRTNI